MFGITLNDVIGLAIAYNMVDTCGGAVRDSDNGAESAGLSGLFARLLPGFAPFLSCAEACARPGFRLKYPRPIVELKDMQRIYLHFKRMAHQNPDERRCSVWQAKQM